MDNLFEQMANITKAHAYDIVAKQRDELLEENKRLKIERDKFEGGDLLKGKRIDQLESAHAKNYPKLIELEDENVKLKERVKFLEDLIKEYTDKMLGQLK